jgi:hypothetical protein
VIAFPIPRAPPVTTATEPSNFMIALIQLNLNSTERLLNQYRVQSNDPIDLSYNDVNCGKLLMRCPQYQWMSSGNSQASYSGSLVMNSSLEQVIGKPILRVYKKKVANISALFSINCIWITLRMIYMCGYIYTQANITQESYSPEYITPTQQMSWLLDYTDIEGTRLSSEISHTRTDLTA